jgi:RNA polymerase sigma-70 factor (ECF subfamily)
MTMLRAEDGTARRQGAYDDVDIARDRALVTRAQQGDRGAFEDLYVRYHRRLWRFCYKRLQDVQEAEDVVQEAFVRAWRALPGFAGDRRFYPWLSVIAAHLCSNVTRRRNRMDPVEEFSERDLVSWEDCGEDCAMANHDWETVAKAYARLSARHRSVLDLRMRRGWSYQRIADHEGVRVSTIESLLWRAREALKREFAAEEGAGLAGMAGALLSGLRRCLRAPQAIAERAAALSTSGASVFATAAGMAAGALAVVAAASVVVGSSTTTPAPGRAADSGLTAAPMLAGTALDPGWGASLGLGGSASGASSYGPGRASGPGAPGAEAALPPGPGAPTTLPGPTLTPPAPPAALASETAPVLPNVPVSDAPAISDTPAIPAAPLPSAPAPAGTVSKASAATAPALPTTTLSSSLTPPSGEPGAGLASLSTPPLPTVTALPASASLPPAPSL